MKLPFWPPKRSGLVGSLKSFYREYSSLRINDLKGPKLKDVRNATTLPTGQFIDV